MDLFSPILTRYIEEHSSPEPALLAQLRREAHVHLLQPRMLSGHVQGQLLAMLVQLKQPRNILEIGTYTGYASLAMAEHLTHPGGKLHTIECDDEREDFIRRSFALFPHPERLELHIGRAEDLLPQLVTSRPFDLVYIDANKRHYLEYYLAIIEDLPAGALIIADNTLWDGKVLEETAHDLQTEGIRQFNKHVACDPKVSCVLLPLRDGLTLIHKH